jgi:beta-lactamase class A
LEDFNNPYPLIDPMRSLVNQKFFFSTIEPVRREIKQIVADYEKEGHVIGLYFEFLNTGANISINQDTRFWPASLSKMPTVFAVMKKVERGEWKLSNELVLFSEDQDETFGELYKKVAGTRFTIEELLKETLINSDNTAHRILVRNLSSADYTDIFEALGMEGLFDENYDITAKEYSRIFKALYNASYLDRENSQKLLTWLSRTKFTEFLKEGLPPEVLFSHKIGEEYKKVVFLDSGIAYIPDRPYILTVMIKINNGDGMERAREIMKKISQATYNYVVNH